MGQPHPFVPAVTRNNNFLAPASKTGQGRFAYVRSSTWCGRMFDLLPDRLAAPSGAVLFDIDHGRFGAFAISSGSIARDGDESLRERAYRLGERLDCARDAAARRGRYARSPPRPRRWVWRIRKELKLPRRCDLRGHLHIRARTLPECSRRVLPSHPGVREPRPHLQLLLGGVLEGCFRRQHDGSRAHAMMGGIDAGRGLAFLD
jgi:hypothetical protein